MTIFGNRDSSYGSSMSVADVVPLPSGTGTPPSRRDHSARRTPVA